ncbi:MAG: AAA family ATPase [Flavobacteriales bacterium]
MSGFKLLAIRPLEGCDSKFSKVLTSGRIYRFYNDYTFYDSSNKEHNIEGEVTEIKYKPTVLDDLYKINDINLNISAVVGKNGSGKSSLIELLFVANFLLAMQENILKNHSKKDESIEETLERLETEHKKLQNQLESIFKNGEFVKKAPIPYSDNEKTIRDSVYQKLKLDQRKKWKTDEINKLSNLVEEYNSLKEIIKVEIYYQISQTVFKLRIHPNQKDKNCQIEIVPTNFSDLETDDFKQKIKRNLRLDKLLKNPLDLSEMFFYSLVLNYSQYALNSKEIGDWIIELFHKNDGYQTPIVINPMRDEGNFDINRENDLVKQRLLINILTPLGKGEKAKDSLRHLAQNHIAHRIKITLNEEKFKKNQKGLEYLKNNTKIWKIIEKEFFDGETIDDKDWNKYAKGYIIGKLISMAEKYPPYLKFYDGNKFIDLTVKESEDKISYLDALKKDDSHIAYKFHQAINFLKYDYATQYFNAQKSKSINDIAESLKIDGKELKHLIPPSFLIVDILFDEKEPENDIEETNTLQNLSSGEKQYIYSISSIMYHLRYLDSVKIAEEDDDEKVQNRLKYKYKYINLVFDEIELYYHPELQRQFIFDFRNAIERCKLNYIKNINCTFVTHSPFILSDIPSSNILRLERGNTIDLLDEQTLGANIHDLLANNFFLENGFMGEFVRYKLEDLIKYLSGEETKFKWDNESAKKMITTVGEPYLKSDLLDLYNSMTFKNTEDIDLEIERLSKRRIELRSKNDSNR